MVFMSAMGWLILYPEIFGGGAVIPALGDRLADAGVRLCNTYAGTEIGLITYTMRHEGDEKEWQYVRFLDNLKIRWISQGDGTFECQFLVSVVNLRTEDQCPY
jgi:hypothetical protein